MMKKMLAILMTLSVVCAQGTENDTGGQFGYDSWMAAMQDLSVHATEDFQQDTAEAWEEESRIVGGAAATVGQFPWQVGIVKDGAAFCGGSIISSHWVLTAGHCVFNATSFVLVFGSLSPYGSLSGSLVQTTTSFVLHDKYRFAQDPSRPGRAILEHDIGLIWLPYPLCVWTNSISVLKLPTRSQQSLLFVDEKATASGWGFFSYPPKGISPSLQFVELLVITNRKCEEAFVGVIVVPPSALCTAAKIAKSTYNGDSGGALVWKDAGGSYRQIGVVSFGNGVGSPLDFPSGFTRVTAYLDWISNITGIAVEL